MENLMLKSSGWWVAPWNRTVVGGLPATKVEVERGGVTCAIAVNKLSESERETLGIMPWQEYGPAKFHEAQDWEIVEEAGMKIRRPLAVEFNAEEAKAELIAKIDGKRKIVEEGGVVVDGIRFATNQKGRTSLVSVQASFEADADHLENDWLAQDAESGETIWVSMDAVKYGVIITAIRAHIRACFAEQRRKSEELVPAIDTYQDYQDFIESELDSLWS